MSSLLVDWCTYIITFASFFLLHVSATCSVPLLLKLCVHPCRQVQVTVSQYTYSTSLSISHGGSGGGERGVGVVKYGGEEGEVGPLILIWFGEIYFVNLNILKSSL
jgi:hypothetical protein